MSTATATPAEPACTYQRFTFECRGDGFLWDADHDGWDPTEQDHPCPRCNVPEFLARAKEEAQSTVDWQSGGECQTGEDIWLNHLAYALKQNPDAVPAALAELGPVDALVPDATAEDGCAVRRHNDPAPVVDLLGDVPAAEPLGAYWVGEHDVYAARSPEQALELCEGHSGMPGAFDMDDVREMTAGELDKPLQEEDGTPCGTVRQMLAAMTAPGELVSFE